MEYGQDRYSNMELEITHKNRPLLKNLLESEQHEKRNKSYEFKA